MPPRRSAKRQIVIGIVAACLVAPAGAGAQPVADFYRGKTV
ncbi:MAG: hypothetical protein QOC56_238, partial [Alphaproteobacteria bacterium]|nr:hypothetical protein [Alphaproteobacteria bacterium]